MAGFEAYAQVLESQITEMRKENENMSRGELRRGLLMREVRSSSVARCRSRGFRTSLGKNTAG